MNPPLSFLKRASLTRNPLGQTLFKLMEDKQTNLGVAADVTSQKELLHLADLLGPQICLLKTHVDILSDFTPDFPYLLQEIAKKHQFLIFEDRKFADIGSTSALQYKAGLYKIADWAHLINAHIVPGPGIIEGLKTVGLPKNRALLLLAEMSSHQTLAKGAYTKKAVTLASQFPDFVIGFIALHRLTTDPSFIHMTPGVNLNPGKDALGQRYRTVDQVIGKNLSDLIIVGRDIIHDKNPPKKAALYQEKAWLAYKSSRGLS